MEAHVIFFLKIKIQVAAVSARFLLTVLWDSQRLILEHYTERGTTVIRVNYCDMLRNEPRPAIRTNRRGSLSQGVVLLHDNGRPHTAHLAINTTGRLNSEVLGHPAYSPELDPSDFHPFGPLKNALRSRGFVDDDKVKGAMLESFVIKLKLFLE
jgi:histone-lysine N-methyltransferase SETMAR